MKDLIKQIDGEARVSHRVIAENTQNEDRSISKLITDNKADFEIFGTLRFKIEGVVNNGKGEQPKTYYLNEQQATLLMTYLRNNEVVKKFKLALVRAFYDLKGKQTAPALPKSYKEALQELIVKVEEIEKLENKIQEDKPLVSFAKSVEASVNAVLIRDWVKSLCEAEGVKIGQNRAYEWLRTNGYLMKNNEPYQKYMDNGYFERVPYTFAGTSGTHLKHTTKITGKGQIALAKKIVDAFKEVA